MNKLLVSPGPGLNKRRFKTILYVLALPILFSCNNSSSTGKLSQQFKPPVSQDLKFSQPKKINWAGIPVVNIEPSGTNLDLSKLPEQSYDSTRFKAFSQPVTQVQFDYNSIPGKDLDIEKLTVKPLKFKTYVLPPPQFTGAGQLHLKNKALSLYEFGDAGDLQHAGISCVYKDNDGFLWIATLNGELYRYDGENLLLFIADQTGYYINSILQDNLGRIWVSMFGDGLEVLDIKNGVLKKTDEDQGLDNNKAHGMVMDEQQHIWVALDRGGVDIIDPKTETVQLLDNAHGLSAPQAVLQITPDAKNRIWLATNDGGGLNMVDLKNNKIKYFDQAHGLSSDSIVKVVDSRGGGVLIGFKDGAINVLDVQQKNVQTINELRGFQTSLLNLFEDSNGKTWACTNNGIYILDLKRRVTDGVLKTTDGLNGHVIQSVQVGNDGQVWLGTNNGLNVVSNQQLTVEHIGNERTATVIEDKDGLIWQGTNNGVNIINRKTKTIRHLGKQQGLNNDTIQLIKEIQGQIFIGNNDGLNVIDSSRTSILKLGSDQGLANKAIFSIAVDKSGRFWIGGDQDGIDVLDPRSFSLKHLGKARGLSDGYHIDDIAVDTRGHIWVSTRLGGIDEIDPATWNISYLTKLSGIKILRPDDKGNVWIGTNKGIYIADSKNNKLISFTGQQGLIDETVISLLLDKGHIYAGTDKGITEITPPETGVTDDKNWQVKSSGATSGLSKINTETYATDMITRDGLYCWGDDGLTLLNLAKNDRATPPVFINGMNIMDEPQFFIDRSEYQAPGNDTLLNADESHYTGGRSLANTGYVHGGGISWNGVTGPYDVPDNLTLLYDQNFIQFHFNNLNLTRYDTTWYRYKLSGADKVWTETTAGTSRNYFSLSPGTYTFEVTGRTAETGWAAPAKFSFRITPPWWQTWWAYVAYVCLFAASAWAFGHYRSLRLMKDNRILENKISLRTEEVMQQKEEIEAQRDNLEKAVSELKVMQSQLIQSEKLASLGEVTAGIAHEIQNPLNFVNNFSEVSIELLKELREEQSKAVRTPEIEDELFGDLEQNLEKINQHGKRADGIVKSMLHHSSSTSGQRQQTDINVLVDEYMRLSYHGIRAKDKTFNAAITTDQDNRLPKVNVAPQDVGRVFLNIFNNAFYAVSQKQKQTPEHYQPTVSLTTLRNDGFVEVRIKDNGNGIPESIRDKIMQPFFTTKPAGEGTGLGLSLSYDIIVKGYGGKITVDTRENEYTEFTVALPIQA